MLMRIQTDLEYLNTTFTESAPQTKSSHLILCYEHGCADRQLHEMYDLLFRVGA
jgi:hypothetical protein